MNLLILTNNLNRASFRQRIGIYLDILQANNIDCEVAQLPSSVMGQFICHLAHATQVVNPQEFTLRKKTVKKCHRLVNKIMSSEVIKGILGDGSLDQ